jgi:hypothetical protein
MADSIRALSSTDSPYAAFDQAKFNASGLKAKDDQTPAERGLGPIPLNWIADVHHFSRDPRRKSLFLGRRDLDAHP